jgi:hypothetical protein
MHIPNSARVLNCTALALLAAASEVGMVRIRRLTVPEPLA